MQELASSRPPLNIRVRANSSRAATSQSWPLPRRKPDLNPLGWPSSAVPLTWITYRSKRLSPVLLSDVPVEVGDFVQPGQLCAQVVELNPLKVSAEITEQEIGKISLTRGAQLTLVSGETLSGKISYYHVRLIQLPAVTALRRRLPIRSYAF